MAPCLRDASGKEVQRMALDMTAQLAPMVWGMVALLMVATFSVLLSHE